MRNINTPPVLPTAPLRLCAALLLLLAVMFPAAAPAAGFAAPTGALAESESGLPIKRAKAQPADKTAAADTIADSGAEADKSWFLSFIESKLSAPNRRISLSQIEGALSSQASVGLITVADRQGIWLRIKNAQLDWNRAALLLGRVSVTSLSADSIEILRRPLPNGQPAPLAAGGGFALPDLPVGLAVQSLKIRQIALGQAVIGQAAALSLEGGFTLNSGRLDMDLLAKRLDSGGGDFKLAAHYDRKKQDLTLDSRFDEPQNGLAAALLEIDGRPPLHFSAAGGGKAGAWTVNLHMEAAAKSVLDGLLSVQPAAQADGSGDRKIFNFAAAGPVANILPPVYRPFFGAKTALNLHGALKAGGGVRVDRFSLNGDCVSLFGAGEVLADGFLRRLTVQAALGRGAGGQTGQGGGQAAGGAVILPLKGGVSAVDALRLDIAYGEAGSSSWTGRLSADNLQIQAARVKKLRLEMGGAAENLDAAPLRHISAVVKGALAGVTLQQPHGAAAVPQIDIALDSDWRSGQALAIRHAALNGGGVTFSAQGAVENSSFNGAMRFVSANIADFAQFLGQKWTGSVNLALRGMVGLGSGAFDIEAEGGSGGLATDNAALNGLLHSDIAVSGGLARDKNGVRARNFRIANGSFRLFANGAVSESQADLDFGLNVADMALLAPFIDSGAAGGQATPKASGAVDLRGAARGHNGLIAVAAQAMVAKGQWNARPVKNLQLGLNAMLDTTSPLAAYNSALITGAGLIGGDTLHLSAALHQNDDVLRLDSIDLRLGEASLRGALQSFIGAEGRRFWNGALALKADNIAPLAALGFMEGKGKANMDIALRAEPAALAAAGGRLAQNMRFSGMAEGLSLGYPALTRRGAALLPPLLAVQSLAGHGQAFDIFALPQLEGSLKGKNIRYAAYGIESLSLDSERQGQDSALKANITLAGGGAAAFKAVLSPIIAAEKDGQAAGAARAGDWQLLVRDLAVRGLPAAAERYDLAQDPGQTARFAFRQNRFEQVDGLALSLSQKGKRAGFAKLDGSLSAENYDFTATLQNVPLALADSVRPDLGLRGSLSGLARLQGTRAQPLPDFDIAVRGGSAAALRCAGLAPLNVQAQGQTQNDVLTLSALLAPAESGGKGGAVQMRLGGQVFMAAQKLHLTADTENLPLALPGGFIHNPLLEQQQLSGALTAQAQIEGSFSNPQVKFSARAARLSAAALAAGKIAPLTLETAGMATKQMVRLEKFTLSGGQALQFTAAGAVPLSGAGLDMQVKGSLPLALANGLLERQGAQLGGILALDSHIGGALANPQMQGSFAVRQGRFLSAPLNLRLEPIQLSGRLSGNQIVFEQGSLRSYQGGALTVTGALSLDKAASFPARLQLAAAHFGYNDGATVAAVLNGALTVNGALLQGAAVSGKVLIEKAEIRVPDSFGSASLPELDNLHITPPIALTQKRAGVASGKAAKQAAAEKAQTARMLPTLNIEIAAPNQIFVRGRGLDAEMGGNLQLTGRADAMQPRGGFSLIRGRFDILAQRLVFRQGQVSLTGNFNPNLDFSAVSSSDDVSVTVTVSGTPKALKITLSSDPALPQDEILARLIFKRSLNELSPIQIAQLVDAAAEMTGITQGSALGKLRSATGLDQLDVSTDSAGNAAVSAGRYILNKLYLGVETAAGGASKGTVNLDITPHLKAKGAVGSDSNSNLGIFFERDY